MPKVYIVGNDWSVVKMYITRGWTVVLNPDDADIIQFTGGEDVTPSYYGEGKHPRTYNNPDRDAAEADLFHFYRDKPMVGICRGGQFLNVMCGGSMWQHVDRHAIGGTHTLYRNYEEEGKSFVDEVQVTSTHHQMIIPNYTIPMEIIGWAKESTYKEGYEIKQDLSGKKEREIEIDVEIIFYPEQNVLCFQPHPEYVKIDHECQELYFNLIKDYFGVSNEIN